MRKETTLKIFGTGQITIPKEWRDFFDSDTVKAIFDEKNRKISIRPIKLVEMEETKWVPLKHLKQDLDEVEINKNFKKELLQGYEKSDFYSSGLKNMKK